MANIFMTHIEGDNDIIYASSSLSGQLSFCQNSLLAENGTFLNSKIKERVKNKLLRFHFIAPTRITLSFAVISSPHIDTRASIGPAVPGGNDFITYNTISSSVGSDRYFRAVFETADNHHIITTPWEHQLMLKIWLSTGYPQYADLQYEGFNCEGYNFAIIPEYGYFG